MNKPPMQPIPFGRYLLTERLAMGGTAEIFKAKLVGVEGFEKILVIKRILPHWSANSSFIAMLVDEAKIMVRLNHERVVQVHELGKEGETYYIAMEFIDGIDLRHLLNQSQKANQPLSLSETLGITAEVLRGLDYIHKQKDEQGKNLHIIHRDISPQNILISTEGAIKITDFGIAHAASRSYETATGVLKGKFSYMSPEQARGAAIDQRTDLFALGIILYEMISGKRLFSGGSDLQVLERVREFDSQILLQQAQIDHRVLPILIKALKKNPQERYASAQDFLKDIQDLQRAMGLYFDLSELTRRVQQIKTEGELSPLAEKNEFQTVSRLNPEKPDEEITASMLNQESTRAIDNTGAVVSPPQSVQEKNPENSLPPPSARSKNYGGWIVLLLLLAGGSYFGGKKFFASKKIPEPIATTISESAPARVTESWIETKPESLPVVAESQKKPETLQAKPPLTPEEIRLALEEKRKKERKEKEEKLRADKASGKTEEAVKEEKPDTNTKTASGTGVVNVAVRPIWGTVTVNGNTKSGSSVQFSQVPLGNHSVKVSTINPINNKMTVASGVANVKKGTTTCLANFNGDRGLISCR